MTHEERMAIIRDEIIRSLERHGTEMSDGLSAGISEIEDLIECIAGEYQIYEYVENNLLY